MKKKKRYEMSEVVENLMRWKQMIEKKKNKEMEEKIIDE